MTRPPTAGRLYSQARPRRSPDLPERQPPGSGEDAPKELEQVTHAHTFLNTVIMNWKKYPCESDCMCRSRTPSPARSTSGREAGSLSDKLVCHNSGPMGTEYGTGVLNRLCGNATPRVTTNLSTLYLGAGHSNTGRSIQTPPKAGHTDHKTSLGEGLLLQHFSGTQERWGPKTCDQPQSTQQLCSSRAFQDGGHSHCEGLAGTGRLVNKSRPQGRVLCNSNTSSTSEIPPVQFQGKNYHFTCLPFGLSSAPWVFTKILKPALSILWQMGVQLIAYIDSILIIAESRNQALEHSQALVHLLECLGFIINTEKSLLTADQTIELLGLIVNSISMELRLPPTKIKQIRAESRRIMRMAESTSARTLTRLLGKMNSTACIIPPAPLFYQNLQMALSNTLENRSQDYEGLPPASLEELKWWDTEMFKWNGKTLLKRRIDMFIDSNASCKAGELVVGSKPQGEDGHIRRQNSTSTS